MEKKIQNCPEYAKDYEYIVCSVVDNEFWFYGAYKNGFKARQVAAEIGGIVHHNERN